MKNYCFDYITDVQYKVSIGLGKLFRRSIACRTGQGDSLLFKQARIKKKLVADFVT